MVGPTGFEGQQWMGNFQEKASENHQFSDMTSLTGVVPINGYKWGNYD